MEAVRSSRTEGRVRKNLRAAKKRKYKKSGGENQREKRKRSEGERALTKES